MKKVVTEGCYELSKQQCITLIVNEEESRYVNEKRLIDDEFDSLQEMNSVYVHTTAGSKHAIVSLKKDAINNETFNLEPITEFKNRFLHEAKIAGVIKGVAWLRWSGKRYSAPKRN